MNNNGDCYFAVKNSHPLSNLRKESPDVSFRQDILSYQLD